MFVIKQKLNRIVSRERFRPTGILIAVEVPSEEPLFCSSTHHSVSYGISEAFLSISFQGFKIGPGVRSCRPRSSSASTHFSDTQTVHVQQLRLFAREPSWIQAGSLLKGSLATWAWD